MSLNNFPADADLSTPLCVDLDGTLIRTDILWESIVRLWRNPVSLLRALLALLLHGKAAFKTVLAEAVAINPAALPYREAVLEFARAQHHAGCTVVLATATHRQVAQDIADHLGIFSRVFATENGVNLSGARKREALEAAYGNRGFDYIGDSHKDLPVFAAARHALLIAPSRALLSKTSALTEVSRIFSEPGLDMKVIARALRLHQWAKNALLAVPLLSAHLLLNVGAWIDVALAFLAFGLVASSTYLINDLLDLQSDRLHARKRFRPLASGTLSIPAGLLLVVISASMGFFLAWTFLPSGFIFYLLAYVALTLGYSFYLKRRLVLDVLTLAVLYTLRILAGGVAIGVVVSEWLLMFSLFIFLSLAFLKRAIELMGMEGGGRVSGRGYSRDDLDIVRTIGVSSGLISVLVLSLYISSPAVSQLYRAPHLLWLLCPLVVYWITRIWFLAARGEVDHDPVVFALFDWRSYVIGACGMAIALLATLNPSWLRG